MLRRGTIYDSRTWTGEIIPPVAANLIAGVIDRSWGDNQWHDGSRPPINYNNLSTLWDRAQRIDIEGIACSEMFSILKTYSK